MSGTVRPAQAVPAPVMVDRARRRVLAFLGGVGAGRPRSSGEISTYGAANKILGAGDLHVLLDDMVARGELVATDVVAESFGGVFPRNGVPPSGWQPFRGYALPTNGGTA